MTRGRPFISDNSHRAEREFRQALDRDQRRVKALGRKIKKAKRKRLLAVGMEAQRP